MAVPPLADPTDAPPEGSVATTPAAAPEAGVEPVTPAAAPPATATPGSAAGPPRRAALPPRPTGRSGAFAAAIPPRPATSGSPPAPAPPAAPPAAPALTGKSGSFAAAPPPPIGKTGSPGAAAPAQLTGKSGSFAAAAPPKLTGKSGSFAAVTPPQPTGKSGSFAAVTPPQPTGKSGSFAAVTPPQPTGKSGSFAAVTPPQPTGKSGSFAAVTPPQPTGKSGSFAAVTPPEPASAAAATTSGADDLDAWPSPDATQEVDVVEEEPPQEVAADALAPVPERTSGAPALGLGEGARASVPTPAPSFGLPDAARAATPVPTFGLPGGAAPAFGLPEGTRGSAPTPAPTFGLPDGARGSAPAPAPTFGLPDGARTSTPTPAPTFGLPAAHGSSPAAHPPSSPPAAPSDGGVEATDVTIDEEPDFGATIPDHGPLFHDLTADLTATVPNLPPPASAPVFGLPPEPSSGAARPVAPATPPPPPLDAADDAAASPYGPGAIIDDKYRLIRVIGRGGMGAVWIAQNTALEVEVAVKLMRRDRATPEATARFSTEARAAAKLGHPSIVRVFDFGETARGDPFIVMELLRGDSFGALLARKKKLAPTIAVQTLLPVAHALAAAHAKGIVHRDLKPDNILLAKDESNVVTPKVVDFGIAKLVSADVDRHFTIAGEVLGSPDYMSPEQARGEDDIDHRSDIWTFSVLLYEAISGRRPFTASNYNALLAAIIATRPPALTDLGVGDPTLSAIIEKGLAKDRDARWQSVREMGMELARWAIEQGADHDLAGASLSAQWLEPTRRRLFTVGGSAPPPAPSEAQSAAPEPAIPRPPPLGNLAAEVPRVAAEPISNTLPPFAPRRRPWVVMTFLVIAGGALVAALVWGGLFEPAPGAAPSSEVPATASSPSAAPAITVSPATSETPSTSESASTSQPAASTSKPRAPWAPKPRAPHVKGDIKF